MIKLVFPKQKLVSPIRNIKPEWESRLERQIKKLREQCKSQRKEKHIRAQQTEMTEKDNSRLN